LYESKCFLKFLLRHQRRNNIYKKTLVAREITKYPTKEDVYDYIKSKPNYESSLPLVCQHFLGFVPPSIIGNPERKIYDRMWDKVRKAKQRINTEERGEWKTETGKEGFQTFRFIKSD